MRDDGLTQSSVPQSIFSLCFELGDFPEYKELLPKLSQQQQRQQQQQQQQLDRRKTGPRNNNPEAKINQSDQRHISACVTARIARSRFIFAN